MGKQPTWEGLRWVKPQNEDANKARGVVKATNRGEFGGGKTPKTKSKESEGEGEGNQPGGIWGG